MTVRYSVANGEVFAEKRSGSTRFYRSDALGSVAALYDNSQTKTDAKTYWPYGETRTSSGAFGSKNGFVGSLGCRTQADGGVYMRARVEQPKDGRWLTVDPLWPNQWPYRYCYSSPACLTDISGLATFDCPTPIAEFLEKLCRKIRHLPPNVVMRISECMALNAPDGAECPSLDSGKLQRMVNWCRSGYLRCRQNDDQYWPVTGCAGFTHLDDSISLWPNKIGGNWGRTLITPLPVHVNGGRTVELGSLALSFLHELGHVVGIDHVTSDTIHDCNDTFAFCSYIYLWTFR